jgi:ubiquinone/menaquinone biosynthesis C-methylase UbiE
VFLVHNEVGFLIFFIGISMVTQRKWPKIFPDLTEEQIKISDDHMKRWHEAVASNKKFAFYEKFNHGYPIKHSSDNFLSTLEIGAGLGEHLMYEKLTTLQKENYVALELREIMAEKIRQRFLDISVCVADCQTTLPYPDNHFDRIIAIHVLEHLPNLPAALKELNRVCKPQGQLLVVIPCEGGALYSLVRKFSAQRMFEKRYKQSYKAYIEREHVNKPYEIMEELACYFYKKNTQYFPFLLPSVNSNLCIGMTLQPTKME